LRDPALTAVAALRAAARDVDHETQRGEQPAHELDRGVGHAGLLYRERGDVAGARRERRSRALGAHEGRQEDAALPVREREEPLEGPLWPRVDLLADRAAERGEQRVKLDAAAHHHALATAVLAVVAAAAEAEARKVGDEIVRVASGVRVPGE